MDEQERLKFLERNRTLTADERAMLEKQIAFRKQWTRRVGDRVQFVYAFEGVPNGACGTITDIRTERFWNFYSVTLDDGRVVDVGPRTTWVGVMFGDPLVPHADYFAGDA